VIQLASTYNLTGVTWRTSYKYPYVLVQGNSVATDILINGDETAFADQGHIGIMAHGNNIVFDNIKTNNVNYFPDDWIGGSHGYGTVNAPGYGIQALNSNNVTIRNCITNGNGYEGVGIESSEQIMIENCKVGDGNRTGIQIHRGSKHVVVSGCVIDNHCANKQTDITIHGESTVAGYIEDLKIIGCSCLYPSDGEYGIQTVTGYEKDVVFESCRIVANVTGIITANTMKQTVQNTQDMVITGNIIDSEGGGIEVRGNKCVICNNIIHCANTPITVTGADKVIDNNLID
jgi:hypothetical protein